MPKQLEFSFVSGPLEGKTFTFKGQEVKVGSGNDCDLVIADKYVAKLHCTVSVEKRGVVLHNQSVVGATFVNGERVDHCLLNDGDQIAFGGGIALKYGSREVQEGFQAPFRTPSSTSFKLQVDSGVMKWSAYEYTKDLVRIGSQRGCDLLLADAGVELQHFQIVAEANDFVLYNESKSGVKVNGQKVERRVLQTGDKVEIGESTVLTFSELVVDVRLAKPRSKRLDGHDLQDTRKKASFFQNPVFIAGVLAYMGFVLLFAVVLMTLDVNDADGLVFGGGFGFRSKARGVYVAKSVGQDLYTSPVQIRGRPADGDPFKIISGRSVLYDSDDPRCDTKEFWPKSPVYLPTIISDEADATRNLGLGRELVKNRNISPDALYKSILHLRRGEAHCPNTNLTLKKAVEEELAAAEKALAVFFEDQWLDAYIKTRANDYRGAGEIYEFLRKLIPDETNPGNTYARNAQINVTQKAQ